MADIFLSYAKEDRSKVMPVVALLEAVGYSVWWDKRIGGGDQWDEVIERELNAAKCVVVVWSRESVSSRWVRSEASTALERNRLIPITIVGSKPPLAFTLIQTTDFSNWDRRHGSDEARHLVEAVHAKTGAPPALPRKQPQHFSSELSADKRTEDSKRPGSGLAWLLVAVIVVALGGAGAGAFIWQRDVGGPLMLSHGVAFKDCPHCPEMVGVARSQFAMGSDKEGVPKFEGPVHTVMMKGTIGIGKYEVTNMEYQAFLNAMLRAGKYDIGWVQTDKEDRESPLLFRIKTVEVSSGFENHPVAGVSWRGAQDYADWLSKITGKVYRLPSEAEWEFAARAGTTVPLIFGDDALQLCEHSNIPDHSFLKKHTNWIVFRCTDGYVGTAPVGRFAPNPFGLHDVFGNVWEWTRDCWHDDYNGAPTDGSAWTTGGDCSSRVIRGGSFDYFNTTGVTLRRKASPNERGKSMGFRVVRE